MGGGALISGPPTMAISNRKQDMPSEEGDGMVKTRQDMPSEDEDCVVNWGLFTMAIFNKNRARSSKFRTLGKLKNYPPSLTHLKIINNG